MQEVILNEMFDNCNDLELPKSTGCCPAAGGNLAGFFFVVDIIKLGQRLAILENKW
jgi:hypothetical protein